MKCAFKGGGIWKKNPKAFLRWLKQAKLEKFLTEQGVAWFHRFLSTWQKSQFRKHFEATDPEGWRRFKRLRRALRSRKKELALLKEHQVQVEEDSLLVAQEMFEQEGITKLRFVQGRGILNIIASMKAAGFSSKEVVDHLGVQPEVVASVTPDRVQTMQDQLYQFIIRAADQKVYHDLMKNLIGKDTQIADQIARGRRKLMVDAASREQPTNPMLPVEAEAKESGYKEFFGVERRIDLNAKEHPDHEGS